VCAAVVIPEGRPVPSFDGPIVEDGDFYFICSVPYNDSLEVNFDVTLTADGKPLSNVVKKVSSASSLDVMFTSQDFKGEFGKLV